MTLQNVSIGWVCYALGGLCLVAAQLAPILSNAHGAVVASALNTAGYLLTGVSGVQAVKATATAAASAFRSEAAPTAAMRKAA